MRFLFPFIPFVVCLLLISACDGRDVDQTAVDSQTPATEEIVPAQPAEESPSRAAAAPVAKGYAGVEWALVRIGGEEVMQGARLTLIFNGRGRIQGRGGCNNFFGSYTRSETGDVIIEGPLGSTRMACLDENLGRLESRYLDLLTKVVGLKTGEDGNTMILATSDGQTLEYVVVRPKAGESQIQGMDQITPY